MTRYVVDPGTILYLAERDAKISAAHKLVAPALVRSQVLSLLHQSVGRGELTQEVARVRLRYFNALSLRLLGDGVLRRRAWEIADEMGWAETYTAEYIALTQLQADAFVTTDPDLRRQVQGMVETADVSVLIA